MAIISKATAHNWQRLSSNAESRLKSRANKTESKRRIKMSGYLRDNRADSLLQQAFLADAPTEEIMKSLCICALQQAGLAYKPHVAQFIAALDQTVDFGFNIADGTFSEGCDVLGFIYQSLTDEGQRNRIGLYYTSAERSRAIISDLKPPCNAKLLDPCCGSGAFLLAADCLAPENLFGFDTDPIAVMIATTNLLLKYPDKAFRPNIFLHDFLADSPLPDGLTTFDCIATNPPWGSDRERHYAAQFPEIQSRERASMFISKALNLLVPAGRAAFLLPSSLLNSKVHSDIRQRLLEATTISRICLCNKRFDGVFTDFFSINLTNQSCATQRYQVLSDSALEAEVSLNPDERKAGKIATHTPNNLDSSILDKMEALRSADLSNALWALGIVTGNNKEKLLSQPSADSEPIYTGKDVHPLHFGEAQKHVRFNPTEFQQCAREELYRAPEKLVYRFIAKYPIVAYDNRGLLCLNSANVVIPRLEGVSVRSAAVLMNSSLYRFYYLRHFSDIKVLKSNLCQLPFPKLTPQQDAALSRLADTHAEDIMGKIDKKVFALFGITAAERRHILQFINPQA